MIKLRLATPDSRKQLIVEETKTPREILEENEVFLEGASINLDGIPLTRDEFATALGDMVSTETATLSVVVKTSNA